MIEYKLSDYLNAINFSKVNLLDGDDITWEKTIDKVSSVEKKIRFAKDNIFFITRRLFVITCWVFFMRMGVEGGPPEAEPMSFQN